MDVRGILTEARSLCETHWSQDDGFGQRDEKGKILSCCVVGAITAAATEGVELTPIFVDDSQARQLLDNAVDVYGSCLGFSERNETEDWNDAANRTRDEVLEVFDCAISKVNG